MKKSIVDYLISQYQPHTIILYGSYADGSNSINSDFDVLIITDKQCIRHDSSIVEGVLLDAFIYHTSEFMDNINFTQYVQIHDGDIVLDKYKYGEKLQSGVCSYIETYPKKSEDEKLQEIEWCEKMLSRLQRNDAEGYFRWHWLLVDSLEIYFDLCEEYYYGPKKSINKMKQNNSEAYSLYHKALSELNFDALQQWITYLKSILIK